MRIEDAKMVLDYAADIQKKLRAIAAEKDLLEGDLNCLRGIEYGGMPHGSGHSDSTADIAQRAEELGSLDRLRELEVQEQRKSSLDFNANFPFPADPWKKVPRGSKKAERQKMILHDTDFLL